MVWKDSPPPKRTFACIPEMLVNLREQRGWTQIALARAAGYSERLISKAEAGHTIAAETIAHLAEALSTSEKTIHPEDLITDPVALAKEYFSALHTQGKNIVEAIEHFLHEKVVFRIAGDPNQIPFAGEYSGIEGVKHAFERFFSILEAPANHDHLADYRFVGQGNEVIMWGESWIHPIGQPMQQPIPISHRFVFERGKLILMEDVYDTLAGSEMLQKT